MRQAANIRESPLELFELVHLYNVSWDLQIPPHFLPVVGRSVRLNSLAALKPPGIFLPKGAPMLGWWFFVAHQTPKDWALMPDREQYRLASWETGVSGIRWIEELVAQGQAEKLRGDGYPSRYRARASTILPLLRNEVTGGGPRKWPKGSFYEENIASCPCDKTLVIDAWDQS